MPIYDYACKQCGHRFEYILLSKSPAAECPACGSKDLEQLLSGFAVSSESTQKFNLNQARKKSLSVHKEKAHEEEKYIRDHHDHEH